MISDFHYMLMWPFWWMKWRVEVKIHLTRAFLTEIPYTMVSKTGNCPDNLKACLILWMSYWIRSQLPQNPNFDFLWRYAYLSILCVPYMVRRAQQVTQGQHVQLRRLEGWFSNSWLCYSMPTNVVTWICSLGMRVHEYVYCPIVAPWRMSWATCPHAQQAGAVEVRANGAHHWEENVVILTKSSSLAALHDDVIKWKHFPRNWPFVRGIHRSRWIPHTKASDAELWCFLLSASDKRLSKQPWGWWFETPSWSLWRQCNGKLSFWQLPVQPVMKVSSKWRHFRFSDAGNMDTQSHPMVWFLVITHPCSGFERSQSMDE